MGLYIKLTRAHRSRLSSHHYGRTRDWLKKFRRWKEKQHLLDHEPHFLWTMFNRKTDIKSLIVLPSDRESHNSMWKAGKTWSCCGLLSLCLTKRGFTQCAWRCGLEYLILIMDKKFFSNKPLLQLTHWKGWGPYWTLTGSHETFITNCNVFKRL